MRTFHLQKLNIKPCLGCETCHRDGSGNCVHKDAMGEIPDAMESADVLVLSTPVYFYDVSAQLKTVIDRMYSRLYVRESTVHLTQVALLAPCAGGPEMFEIKASGKPSGQSKTLAVGCSRVKVVRVFPMT